MDEIDFAREQLRRAVLRWANNANKLSEKLKETDSETAKIIMEALIGIQSFPIDEWNEYHDLVRARADTVIAQNEGR